MRCIRWQCSQCKRDVQSNINNHEALTCPSCKHPVSSRLEISQFFTSCPICQCKQFYVQKDFNRGLGCLIILIGILLVPKTYGLSLPIVALIDWLMYKRVKNMAICYRCGAEFCDIDYPKHLKSYRHNIAVKYDKYR